MFLHRKPLLESFDLPRVDVDGKRYYQTPEGNLYPSVTTILSAQGKGDLDKWRKRVGEKQADIITQKAARRGELLHEKLEDYLLNKEVSFRNPYEKMMFLNAKVILDELVLQVHGTERRLYSDKLKAAGTTDLLAKIKYGNSVVDFKSSIKQKKKEWISGYFVQATMYSIMAEERYDMDFPYIMIIISNDMGDRPQLFIEERKNWLDKSLEVIKLAREKFK